MEIIMSADKFAEPPKLYSWLEEGAVAGSHIRAMASDNELLSILEAGCGSGSRLDLSGVPCLLTGVDLDKAALELRLKEQSDLDNIIHGDLRTVTLEDCKYDVIYNCYVLEHVDGAEKVLKNFVRW